MAAIRPAATVLLTCKAPVIFGVSKQNYKLLMVQRSSKNRFMPSAHVFPGGVVESSDGDQKWIKMCGWKGDTKELAFRIAAIREVFEEVNVLISSSTLHLSTQEMADWRAKVQKDASQFYNMCTHFDFKPEPDLLHPYSHWITPDVEKYRYDTKFFVASLPDEYTPTSTHQAAIDAAEVTSLSWFSPDEALAAFRKGTISLPPPTWITLELLAKVHKQEDLKSACSTRSFYSPSTPISNTTVLPYLPQTLPEQVDNAITMTLPGDEAYPDPVFSRKGARHRMSLKGKGDFVYENSEAGILNLTSKL